LILAVVFFIDFVVGEFSLRSFGFAFRCRAGEHDLPRVLGPVKAADVGGMASELPGSPPYGEMARSAGQQAFRRVVVFLLVLSSFLSSFFRLSVPCFFSSGLFSSG
jgi:hypothetical protein